MTMPERCDYDPIKRASAVADEGCPNDATISLNRGLWHLCIDCANLPEFSKFKIRYVMTGSKTLGAFRITKEDSK